MPTYEYACRDCDEHLEVVQSFKDDALTVCPHCQGSLRKVFSAAGLIFKGSGWHVKDYATSSRSPAGSSEGSSEPTTAGTKDGGSDAGAANGGSDTASASAGSGASKPEGTSSGSSSKPASTPAADARKSA